MKHFTAVALDFTQNWVGQAHLAHTLTTIPDLKGRMVVITEGKSVNKLLEFPEYFSINFLISTHTKNPSITLPLKEVGQNSNLK